MTKISKYILKSFIKSFFIVVGSASIIISIVIISQEIAGMNISKTDSVIIILTSLLGIYRNMIVFFISMSMSLTIMEFSRTSQYVIMLASGMNVVKIFKSSIIFTFIVGLCIVFIVKNIEIILTERSQKILAHSKSNQSFIVNLKDLGMSNEKIIINANYIPSLQDIKLANVTIIKQDNYIFETIIADDASLTENKVWILSNAKVLNDQSKKITKYNKFMMQSKLTKEDLLKQIDASTKILFGSTKQYTVYQLYDLLAGEGISNEARSALKTQLWSNLATPLKMICALLIVPLVIGSKAVTRNGLKLSAIFMPQITVGLYTYALAVIGKIAIGAAKYEFTLYFLPYLSLFCFLVILLNYKKYI